MKLCKDCVHHEPYKHQSITNTDLSTCNRNKKEVCTKSYVTGKYSIIAVDRYCDIERSFYLGLFNCGPWGLHYKEKENNS